MQSRRGSEVRRCEEKVIVVNLGYFSAKKQAFHHTRQTSGFPCVTLYINTEVAVQSCYNSCYKSFGHFSGEYLGWN